MTDAASAGNTSTPAATASTTPAATTATPSTAQPAQIVVTPPATTSEAAKPTAAQTDSAAAGDATKPAETDTTATDKTATAPTPAFKLPEDLKLDPKSVEKFDGFLKARTPGADGKFAVNAQEIVDLYADQARDAFTRWQAQIVAQDKAWETESKGRFSPAQLAAAETGVGFLSSFEPAFRELSKGFRNNPAFVNAMRVIGERLSEDTFEIGGASPTPAKRSAKDVLYPKRTGT